MTLSWVEISRSALLNNVSEIRKNLRHKTKFIAVVKANAYGHGLLQVVSTIKDQVDYLASYHFEDLVLLRREKISQPLLCIGHTLPNQLISALENKIELSISSFESLEAINNFDCHQDKFIIHLCIDSGMGRDGFLPQDLPKILPLLQSKKIEVKGLYCHFAASDAAAFDDYSKKQVAILTEAKNLLNSHKIFPLIHASSTTGIFIGKFETQFDMVRVGGGIYGLWSSREAKEKNSNLASLRAVMSWKSLIVELKSMPRGSHISYGCSFTLQRDSKIAILPVGYFDGIPRLASNKASVIVGGIKVPQLGRVTMNMIIIDVTDVEEVAVGDIATIIGRENGCEVSAQNWGEWSESFNYEIATRINPNLPRQLVD